MIQRWRSSVSRDRPLRTVRHKDFRWSGNAGLGGRRTAIPRCAEGLNKRGFAKSRSSVTNALASARQCMMRAESLDPASPWRKTVEQSWPASTNNWAQLWPRFSSSLNFKVWSGVEYLQNVPAPSLRHRRCTPGCRLLQAAGSPAKCPELRHRSQGSQE